MPRPVQAHRHRHRHTHTHTHTSAVTLICERSECVRAACLHRPVRTRVRAARPGLFMRLCVCVCVYVCVCVCVCVCGPHLSVTHFKMETSPQVLHRCAPPVAWQTTLSHERNCGDDWLSHCPRLHTHTHTHTRTCKHHTHLARTQQHASVVSVSSFSLSVPVHVCMYACTLQGGDQAMPACVHVCLCVCDAPPDSSVCRALQTVSMCYSCGHPLGPTAGSSHDSV